MQSALAILPLAQISAEVSLGAAEVTEGGFNEAFANLVAVPEDTSLRPDPVVPKIWGGLMVVSHPTTLPLSESGSGQDLVDPDLTEGSGAEPTVAWPVSFAASSPIVVAIDGTTFLSAPAFELNANWANGEVAEVANTSSALSPKFGPVPEGSSEKPVLKRVAINSTTMASYDEAGRTAALVADVVKDSDPTTAFLFDPGPWLIGTPPVAANPPMESSGQQTQPVPAIQNSSLEPLEGPAEPHRSVTTTPDTRVNATQTGLYTDPPAQLPENSELPGLEAADQPASQLDANEMVGGVEEHPRKDAVPMQTGSPPSTEDLPQTKPTSFWERFFVDLTFPAAGAAAASPDDAPQLDASSDLVAPMSIGTTSLKPISSQTTDFAADDPRPQSEGHEPQDRPAPVGASQKLTFHAAPLPHLTFESTPLVVVSGWTDGWLALGEPGDAGMSSLLGSLPSASSGSPSFLQSTQSLPVPQVASQLATALVRSAEGVTELALAPEELGRIKLRFEPDAANPDRMVIHISVERPETLDLFRRHAGELANAIRAAGYSGADIGFGQDSHGHPDDRQPQTGITGTGLQPEEPDNPSPIPRNNTGPSLDLRL